VVSVSLAFGWLALLADELNQLGKHVLGGTTFSSNIVLWNESGYFDPASDTKPLLHLWSLGIEEQFYIFWPIILVLARRRGARLLGIILTILIASFCTSWHLTFSDNTAAFYSPLSRSWELMMGSLLAWIKLYKPGLTGASDRENISNLLSLTGIILIFYGLTGIGNAGEGFSATWSLLPVIGTTLIIYSSPNAWINHWILSSKIFVCIGLISYPLYLWHWPLISYAKIILGGDNLTIIIKIALACVSLLLSWITAEVVEKPFRYSDSPLRGNLASLLSSTGALAIAGLFVMNLDLRSSHNIQTIVPKRKGSEFAIGYSLKWFKGKDNWLFLGNAYDSTVAKLELAITPENKAINRLRKLFSKITQTAIPHNTNVVLFIGPDKTSIYPEHLPSEINPSRSRYLTYFLESLSLVPGLTIYDPTQDLLRAKKSEGLLYWKTDTHWNPKGAFIAYSGFSKLLDYPVPDTTFSQGPAYKGDIINISGLKDIAIDPMDNPKVAFKKPGGLSRTLSGGTSLTSFGQLEVVKNKHPLEDKYAWIVGDSYVNGLRRFFNKTFTEVRYVGHWGEWLKKLPDELSTAKRKPDVIVIVKVERSF
jgi:peptidoglycan/LPS O-acetylase OafA/YrhL